MAKTNEKFQKQDKARKIAEEVYRRLGSGVSEESDKYYHISYKAYMAAVGSLKNRNGFNLSDPKSKGKFLETYFSNLKELLVKEEGLDPKYSEYALERSGLSNMHQFIDRLVNYERKHGKPLDFQGFYEIQRDWETMTQRKERIRNKTGSAIEKEDIEDIVKYAAPDLVQKGLINIDLVTASDAHEMLRLIHEKKESILYKNIVNNETGYVDPHSIKLGIDDVKDSNYLVKAKPKKEKEAKYSKAA